MAAFAGRYFDGQAAVQHEVVVVLAARGLEMREGEALLAAWPFEDLRLVEKPAKSGPVRLTVESRPAARLSVAQSGFLDALLSRAPDLKRRGMAGRRRRRSVIVGVALIAVLVLAIAVGVPLLSSALVPLFPKSWVRTMGAATVAQITQDMTVCTGAAGSAALAGLVARLAKVAAAPFPLDVRVVDSDQVNAFAAPGGYIVVLRGLIDQAESGDEVAGVLAHEIGHVIERHPTRGLIRRTGILLVLRQLLGGDSSLGDIAPQLATLLLELSYSRADESAADEEAVTILRRAGIGNGGLVAFFERLARRRDVAGVARYLSTHPAAGERSTAIQALGPAVGTPALTETEFAALKRICARP